MPMPKPKKPEDLTIQGKAAKKLVKVVKPFKADLPHLEREMAELAEKAKSVSSDTPSE